MKTSEPAQFTHLEDLKFQHNLTYQEIADACGLHFSTIWRLARGVDRTVKNADKRRALQQYIRKIRRRQPVREGV